MSISSTLATQLLNAAPDPTVMVDSEGAIIYANARVETMLGYTPDELIGQPIEILLPHRVRESHPSHRGNFFKKPRARAMGSNLELYALRKDGVEIPVEISLNLLETENGKLVSSAIRDMSEQKAIAQRLAEADRSKTRFLAAASHDLRQPIQTLNLLNKTIRRISKQAQVTDLLEKQQKSLDWMSKLLNSLLDISKLEAGVIEPTITSVSVAEIFDNLRATFEIQALNKGLRFSLESNKNTISSDSKLLSQILENFISNAIRYTNEGEIRLHCDVLENGMRIEVTDTGIGISGEDLDSIFEEFHQAQANDTRGGLGLGLSIVRRTAELLNCKIGVHSELGVGSCFYVEVPLAEATAQKEESNSYGDYYVPRGARILVVDDEPDIVEATTMLLELEGFECMSATSLETLETVLSKKSFVPDVLVSDFHLRRGETGLQIIDAARRQYGDGLPAILVSGDTTNRNMIQGRENITFLTKPVDVDQLISKASVLVTTKLAAA